MGATYRLPIAFKGNCDTTSSVKEFEARTADEKKARYPDASEILQEAENKKAAEKEKAASPKKNTAVVNKQLSLLTKIKPALKYEKMCHIFVGSNPLDKAIDDCKELLENQFRLQLLSDPELDAFTQRMKAVMQSMKPFT